MASQVAGRGRDNSAHSSGDAARDITITYTLEARSTMKLHTP